MAVNTTTMRLGTCVTNPATRDITVTASVLATLRRNSRADAWTSASAAETAPSACDLVFAICHLLGMRPAKASPKEVAA